jgi:hypothetical protein
MSISRFGMAEMTPGERRYIDVAAQERHFLMGQIRTAAKTLAGMSFSVTLYTAIAAADCGDIRYLLAIDRNA